MRTLPELRWSLACLLLGLCWLWGLGPARGAPPMPADTLFLQEGTALSRVPELDYCLVPGAQPGTGAAATALWAAGRFRHRQSVRVFQAGFTQQRLWLRVVVANALPRRTRFVCSLYAFVDSATLFMQPGGRGVPRYVVGTNCRLVPDRRPFLSRSYCLPFWLEPHERAVLYVCVDNHTGAYYLPLRLASADGFLTHEYGFLFRSSWTWLLGLLFGSALLNLLLFAWLRDHIHLWYGVYMLLGTWFLVMEDGLDGGLLPQPAYGLGWRLGQYGVLLLALACGLRLMALFLRLRQGWPRLHRLSRGLSGAAAAFVLAYALLYGAALRAGPEVLAALHLLREALLWALLLSGAVIVGTVAGRGRRAQRQLARLYGLTYLPFFLGTSNFLVNHTGRFNIHFIAPNTLAYGLALELLLLSVLLISRFRQAQRLAINLRLRHWRERAATGQRLIAAQEEEREALARELHDALAPGLTALHLAWQGRLVREALTAAPPLLAAAHTQAEALLRQLRREVHALGHALLPVAPGDPLPLPEALALLTDTLTLSDDGPAVTSHCDPLAARLPAPLQQAAYRIVAELLHNALRHAHARHVRVEASCPLAGLRLVVADDGHGFGPQAPSAPRSGLGLRSVQARAAYLRGQVQVASRPGQGTTVTVLLPA